MKRLLTITDRTFDENAPEVDTTNFRHREAARCVVFDDEGRVGLIHSRLSNYYKIAGGGIEENENKIEAVKREALEELGVNIEIDGEIGEIFEIRNKFKLTQTSYCYYGHTVGEKGQPHFTDKETAEQFEVFWAEDIDVAIELTKIMGSDEEKTYQQSFMILRDGTFLRKAKKMLQ